MNEDETKVEDILTAKQERFCMNYAQNYELFGNATLSYAEAYGYDLDSLPKDDGKYLFKDGRVLTKFNIIEEFGESFDFRTVKCLRGSTYQETYDLCSSLGSRLRRNEKIQKKCRELLNQFMNNEVIDARLTEIIVNGADDDSINAIKEYNKLKQRITEKKDITSNGKTIDGFNFLRAEEPKDEQHQDKV